MPISAHHEAAVAVGRLQHVAAGALGLLGKPLDAGHAAGRAPGTGGYMVGQAAGRQAGGEVAGCPWAARARALVVRPPAAPDRHHPPPQAHPLSNSARDSASGLPLSRVIRRQMSSRAATTPSYQLRGKGERRQRGARWRLCCRVCGCLHNRQCEAHPAPSHTLAHRRRMLARSLPGRRPQSSNRSAAAAMAARVSSPPQSGTLASGLPVAGLNTWAGQGRAGGRGCRQPGQQAAKPPPYPPPPPWPSPPASLRWRRRSIGLLRSTACATAWGRPAARARLWVTGFPSGAGRVLRCSSFPKLAIAPLERQRPTRRHASARLVSPALAGGAVAASASGWSCGGCGIREKQPAKCSPS